MTNAQIAQNRIDKLAHHLESVRTSNQRSRMLNNYVRAMGKKSGRKKETVSSDVFKVVIPANTKTLVLEFQ